MSRKPVFALVDCNNFFVSCERVFRPDLWDKPVAVLSNNDGCIVARSDEVKALGVPMAAPYFKHKDILDKAKVHLFSANFALYGDFSERVDRILSEVCPDIEVYSVDESFLEISTLNIKDYQKWGEELREHIWKLIGIPVSVGVGPSKTLAKAAAEYCKKSTIPAYVIGDEQSRESVLELMPVGDVWGVGYRSVPKMHASGIRTALDLSLVSDKWALQNMTIRGLRTVKELRGESCFELHSSHEPQKTILRSRSFGSRVFEYNELEAAVATFAASAALKLRQQNELAGAIVTFIRGSKHDKTHSGASHITKLYPHTSSTGDIIAAALDNLQKIYDSKIGYKRAGVILLDLCSKEEFQLGFDTDLKNIDKNNHLMKIVDEYNKKFSVRLIRHASEHLELNGWKSQRKLKSQSYTTSWAELPRVRV